MKKMLPFARPTLDEETIQGVVEVLRSGWLASGPKVAEFEAALSEYLGGRPVRTQTSATASLEMALLACGVGAGDEVITPALSFVATANVIVRTGARPVFVDVGLDTRNIDLDAGGGRHHPPHACHPAGAFCGLAGGHGPSV